MLSDNITCFSPDILPSPTHGTSDLVLWMLQERSSLSCCILYNRGSWVLAQLLSLSPAGESQADKFSLSSKLCCPWGGLMWHAHVVPLTHYSASFSLFSPEKYWNFSSGNLDFYKGSLVCGWLSQRPPGIPGLWPRGSGTGSQATAGSTAGTEVCQPIT